MSNIYTRRGQVRLSENYNYTNIKHFEKELDKLVNVVIGNNSYNININQIVRIFGLIKTIDEGLILQLRQEIKNKTGILLREIDRIVKSRILQIKEEIKKAEIIIRDQARIQAKAQAQAEKESQAQARIQAKAQAQAEKESQALLVKQIEKDIAKIIINKFDIITFEEDSKQMLLYENGVFLKAGVSLSKIKQEILKIVSDKFDKYQETLSKRGMIIEIIKNMTPFPILNFKLDGLIINLKNGAIIHRKDGLKFITHTNLKRRGIILYTFIQFPIYYKKGAKCPTINKMMLDVFGNDQIIDVMEFVAYILMPTIEYDKGMILQGPQDTGQTTFMNLIKKFLGRKNYTMKELFTLGKQFQMANLRNKAAIIADDLTYKSWKEITCSRMKRIITNDQLNSGIKFVQGDEDWWNRCKVLCAGNKLPDPVDKSDAWWKRWIVIFCLNRFKGKNRNTSLKSKIWSDEDKSGFLNECIRAWFRLYNRGSFRKKWLNPDYVKKQWLSNISPVPKFIDKYCNYDDINQSIDKKEFDNKFNEKRKENGLIEYTGNLITRKLVLFDEKLRPRKVNKESNPKSSGWKIIYLGWNGLLEAEKNLDRLKGYINSEYVEFDKLDIDDNVKMYDPALKRAV